MKFKKFCCKRNKKRLKKILYMIFKKIIIFLDRYLFDDDAKKEIIGVIKDFLIYIILPNYKIKKKQIHEEIINFCKSTYKLKSELNRNILLLKKFVSIINKHLYKIYLKRYYYSNENLKINIKRK